MMAKSTDELLNYWPIFEKYEEYAAFKRYPTMALKESLRFFNSVMNEITKQPVSKWKLPMISQGLTEIAENAREDPNDDAESILILIYDVDAAYLRCLSDHQIISIDFDDLENFLIDFEERYDLQGPVLDPELVLPTAKGDNKSNLPEWRAYIAKNIKKYTSEWLSVYYESPNWKHRTIDISSDLLTMMVLTLTEKAYDEYRKTPKSWTKKAIMGVLTGYFVSNTDLVETEYQQVAPALNGFLAFVAQRGWINEKRVSDYQRFIEAAAPAMLARSADTQSYGPAKLVSQALVEQGIDINDRNVVQKFIDQVNADGGIDSLYDEQPAELTEDEKIPEDLIKVINNPEQLAAIAKIYDPDTIQDYLNSDHCPVSMGWSRTQAIKTHALAVETGLRLWLRRNEYVIPKFWEAADVMQAVVDFIDVLYAQNLVTPAQWSEAALKEIGKWFRESQSSSDFQEMRAVIAGIIGELYATDVLTKKQATQLPAAFNGEPIPKVAKPKKVIGKVVSMKQVRKMLKNKKRRS